MKARGTIIAAAAFTMLACGPAAGAQPDASLATLEAAVSHGDVRAMVALAVKYEYAEGVQQDYAKSNELYCKAAAAGEPQAEVQLGLIYSRGRGVPRDEGIAAELFSRAAEKGAPKARELLQEVRRQAAPVMPACLGRALQPRAAANANAYPDKIEIEEGNPANTGQARYDLRRKVSESINAIGGRSMIVQLPEAGLRGNTHMMMQDKNNL